MVATLQMNRVTQTAKSFLQKKSKILTTIIKEQRNKN